MSSSRRYSTFREIRHLRRNIASRTAPRTGVTNIENLETAKGHVRGPIAPIRQSDSDENLPRDGDEKKGGFSPHAAGATIFVGDKQIAERAHSCVQISAEEQATIEDLHRIYIKYLRRPCDETSMRARLQQVARGSTTIDKIASQLQQSGEFRAKDREFREFWRHVPALPRKISPETREKSLVIRYVGIYGTSGIAKAALGYLEALETIANVFVVFEPCIVQFPPEEEMQDVRCASMAYKRLFNCARPLLVVAEQQESKQNEHDLSADSQATDRPTEQTAEADLIILHGDPSHWSYYAQTARNATPKVVIAGLLVWESDTFPEVWKKHVDAVDFILVPCLWNAEVVRKSAPHASVFVWHHLIHDHSRTLLQSASRFDACQTLSERKTSDKRIFLFHSDQNDVGQAMDIADLPRKRVKILCIGQWNARKNVHTAIETYLDTFSGSDDVVFYVKTFLNYSQSDKRLLDWLIGEWQARQSNSSAKTLPTLILDLSCRTEEYMNCLYRWSDIFFSLARAEGVGLGACTAYSFGKRVVMPSYGGQVDYFDTPYWIQWRKQAASFCDDPAEDHTMCRDGQCRYNVCLNKDHLWAEPIIVDAQRNLIAAYQDTLRAHNAQQDTQYCQSAVYLPTAHTIGQQFVSILRTIAMTDNDSTVFLRARRICPQ